MASLTAGEATAMASLAAGEDSTTLKLEVQVVLLVSESMVSILVEGAGAIVVAQLVIPLIKTISFMEATSGKMVGCHMGSSM